MGFTVTEKAKRPASTEEACFYCNRQIGQEHAPDCVLIQKKVKVRLTVEYEVEEPANWGRKEIEFSRNDGTWCGVNAIKELEKLAAENNGCLCRFVRYEYIGDTSQGYLKEES